MDSILNNRIVTFEFPDSNPYNGRITHEGEQINGVFGATIEIVPDDFVKATIRTRVGIDSVSAVAHMMPQWEIVTDNKPENGVECLLLLNGHKVVGHRTHKRWYFDGYDEGYAAEEPTHFISLSWLDEKP